MPSTIGTLAVAVATTLGALVAPVLPTPTGSAATESPASSTAVSTATSTARSAAAASAPALRVHVVARNLNLPWDVRRLPGKQLLFTQRRAATLSVRDASGVRRIAFPSASVWVSGETGLMGLEVDPDFASNRRIYTCQGGFTSGGGHDVRVMAWTLDQGLTKATSAGRLIGGFPTSTGRHGGCRLLIDRAGSLLIGTGDAAVGTNPRDLDSLGGKTLRIDRFTGAPWPSNPWAGASTPRRFVQTFGHRNVQGLAQRDDGSLWSIEQGSYRDDEANLLVNGGDYGWNPVPGYNESVPMTDQSLPGVQIGARWRSGDPTIATSGGDFVPTLPAWGSLAGTLAMACLSGTQVRFVRFDDHGRQLSTYAPAALRQFGRMRTVVADGGGILLTTGNADEHDVILRVTPVR